jgi:glutamate-5-semialdehyde dehydrogenase
MNISDQLKITKNASREIPLIGVEKRNLVLQSLADRLRRRIGEIIDANAKDLAAMSPDNPMYDRLLLNETRLESIASDIETVISLPFEVGRTIDRRIMPNGLVIDKISVPLGVVAIIFESRPNVTVDVFTLCFKAGNACVLKGGKEAAHSNGVLVQLIRESLAVHDINPDVVYLLPSERKSTEALLSAVGLVDVCIPRGDRR